MEQGQTGIQVLRRGHVKKNKESGWAGAYSVGRGGEREDWQQGWGA